MLVLSSMSSHRRGLTIRAMEISGSVTTVASNDSRGTMAPSTNPDVVIRSFPRDDEEFRADVEAAIAAGRGLGRVMLLVDEVQAMLRAHYPLVALHAQSPLAVLPGEHPAIYAYRDGRVIAVAVR
jgi:hypothetical protein